MAIKLPDPGNGIPEQKTGNDEWTNMQIVRENFADKSNAASRLVGTTTGQIPDMNTAGLGKGGYLSKEPRQLSAGEMDDPDNAPPSGMYSHTNLSTNNELRYSSVLVFNYGQKNPVMLTHRIGSGEIFIRSRSEGTYATHRIYTSGNTTVDSNKNIKTSSPVVRVFNSHLDKIHEANQLPIEYTRNGVGDYTITGTTGLRENDWQIVIPEDDHRNQLIAFTIEDDNGIIRLKTYKRIFSMETFTFGPDLKTPLDIPEGRWVDLHFNDLPQEQLDEPAI